MENLCGQRICGTEKDISELKMDTSQLKSITVGINLNDRFEADGIGLISVNSKYFTKSGIIGNFMTILRQRIGLMRIPYGKEF